MSQYGYSIETLVDGNATTTAASATEDIEVLIGTIYDTNGMIESSVIEVYALTPTDGRIERSDFSYGGPLALTTGTAQLPIEGGTFSIVSVAARVGTAPVGANVVVNLKKNGTTIFDTPADRPTIVDGTNSALVGSWGNTTLTSGDYITVDITQVGSTTPGSDLVVTLRVRKIA